MHIRMYMYCICAGVVRMYIRVCNVCMQLVSCRYVSTCPPYISYCVLFFPFSATHATQHQQSLISMVALFLDWYLHPTHCMCKIRLEIHSATLWNILTVWGCKVWSFLCVGMLLYPAVHRTGFVMYNVGINIALYVVCVMKGWWVSELINQQCKDYTKNGSDQKGCCG